MARYTLYLRSSWGNPKIPGLCRKSGRKTLGELEAPAPAGASDIKHSPTHCQGNIEPHIRTSYLRCSYLTYYVQLSVKITSHVKNQEKSQFEEIKQASESDSHMAQIWELSGWELKIISRIHILIKFTWNIHQGRPR